MSAAIDYGGVPGKLQPVVRRRCPAPERTPEGSLMIVRATQSEKRDDLLRWVMDPKVKPLSPHYRS